MLRVRGGETYTGVETTRVRKDGVPIEVEVSAAPIRDASGSVVSHMALFADITAPAPPGGGDPRLTRADRRGG